MGRRPGTRDRSRKSSEGEPECHEKLIGGKHGIYIVRGDSKLKSMQLIPWEQILCPLPPART
jgi:hypothetical protein